MIGIALYHATDISRHPELLSGLMAASAEMAGKQPFAYWEAVLGETGRASREAKLSNSSRTAIQDSIAEGRFESVQLHELKRKDREANADGAALDLRLQPDGQLGANAAAPYTVYLYLPRCEIVSEDHLARGVAEMSALLDARYGIVYPGTGFTDVLMETTATPVFPWNHDLTVEEEHRKARLIRDQLHRNEWGHRVRTAYWGNVLGRSLVRQLGGLEQVLATAPVERVDSAGEHGLYLQVTKSLPRDNAELSNSLAAFAAYLQPVTLA